MKTKEKGKKRNRKTILKRAGIIIGILLFFVIAAAGAMLAVDASRIKEQFGMKITVNGKSMWGRQQKKPQKNLMRNFRNIR
ncbi:MAG: hypothetical protein ACLUU1_06275 [Ruminococcus sp.]